MGVKVSRIVITFPANKRPEVVIETTPESPLMPGLQSPDITVEQVHLDNLKVSAIGLKQSLEYRSNNGN